MTQPAGDTKQGLLWKQEHLSPLPISTGQPASDILGMLFLWIGYICAYPRPFIASLELHRQRRET